MYIELSSSVVRTALRIYFMIGLVVIALLGDMCCDYRNKLRLLRGQLVKITNMTGWLPGAQLLKSAFQLRRIPGGYLGILMVFTGLIALLSDLATSGFVHTVSRPSRCPFTRGLALNDTIAMYPSMLGTPYFHASSSQLMSWTNGGAMGMYSKANYTADFRADEEDLIGTWNCTDTGQSISYLTTLYNDSDIVTDVTNTDYFYNIWNTTTAISPYGGDSFTRQSLMVSTSAVGSASGWPEAFLGTFEVKFLVDLYDDLEGRTKYMQPVHCTSKYSSQLFVVDVILANIDAPDTLNTWLSGIQGQLYEGYDSVSILRNYLVTLEWILNSMTMVAGATNSMNYSADGLHPITYYDAASNAAVYKPSSTVGCLKPYTLVPLRATTSTKQHLLNRH
jgi:hypothetical protein